MWYFLTLITAIVLAALRVGGVTHLAFQAAAHFFMGGLFVAFVYSRERWMLYLFLWLAALELICAVLGVGKP